MTRSGWRCEFANYNTSNEMQLARAIVCAAAERRARQAIRSHVVHTRIVAMVCLLCVYVIIIIFFSFFYYSPYFYTTPKCKLYFYCLYIYINNITHTACVYRKHEESSNIDYKIIMIIKIITTVITACTSRAFRKHCVKIRGGRDTQARSQDFFFLEGHGGSILFFSHF